MDKITLLEGVNHGTLHQPLEQETDTVRLGHEADEQVSVSGLRVGSVGE